MICTNAITSSSIVQPAGEAGGARDRGHGPKPLAARCSPQAGSPGPANGGLPIASAATAWPLSGRRRPGRRRPSLARLANPGLVQPGCRPCVCGAEKANLTRHNTQKKGSGATPRSSKAARRSCRCCRHRRMAAFSLSPHRPAGGGGGQAQRPWHRGATGPSWPAAAIAWSLAQSSSFRSCHEAVSSHRRSHSKDQLEPWRSVNRRLSLRWFEPNTCHCQSKRPVAWGFSRLAGRSALCHRVSSMVRRRCLVRCRLCD